MLVASSLCLNMLALILCKQRLSAQEELAERLAGVLLNLKPAVGLVGALTCCPRSNMNPVPEHALVCGCCRSLNYTLRCS